MKKLLLIVVISIASLSFNEAKAQSGLLGIDAQFGLPMGDIEDITSLQAGININYYFIEVMEALKIGGRAGYNTYIVESDISDLVEDPSYLMLGGSARYDFSASFFARFDVGYAVGLNDGNDGAMFVEPRLGYNLGNFDIFAYSQGIFDSDISVGALGLGVALNF